MRGIDQISSSSRRFLQLSLLALLGWGCGYIPSRVAWSTAEATHQVLESGGAESLWVRSEVFGESTNAGLNMSASDGRVFILGSVAATETLRILAFDGWSGDILWQSEPKPQMRMLSDGDALFTGETGGGGRITRYDGSTGDAIWSRFFWRASGVRHLFLEGDRLHVLLSPEGYRLLRSSDGKTVSRPVIDRPPSFLESAICGRVFQTPVIASETIIYRTGWDDERGTVCAVDSATGVLLWQTDPLATSNVAAGDDVVFVLAESGELLALETQTGEESQQLRIAFGGSLSFQDAPEPNILAYDTEDRLLFAYLGGSDQLFAFRVENHSTHD
jgi:outer membrane protein assembly factor BamB